MKKFRKIIKKISRQKSLYKKIILFIFFGSIGALYVHNVTRDVYSGDIGDLVTAAWVFGVAHPPGYPLFTFLGYLFMHYIPGPLPPVTKMGFISAIASLVGLIYIYKFANRVTKSLYLSLLSTSILGFSYLYWIQAEIPEVFALNNLFVILILYYSILFYEEKKSKHLYLLVFLCGLSLTHHQTILFIFPSVLLLVVRHFKFVFWNWKRLLIMTGLFVLGLLPYIYVPIAASHNPVVNWNNPTNIANFIHLIRRDSYGGFAPGVSSTPLSVRLILLNNYIYTVIENFSYPIIFVFMFGIIALIRKSRWLFVALLFGYIFSGPFFVFYSAIVATNTGYVGVLERFFVFSTIVLMFIVIYGFQLLKDLLNKFFSNHIYTLLLLLYFLIISFYLIIYNFSKTDLSKTHIGNNLVIDMLSSLPKDSVIMLSGDTTTFNTWYLHYVLGYRADIDIINSNGVASNNYLEAETKKYIQENKKNLRQNLFFDVLEEIRKKRHLFSLQDANYDAKTTVLVQKGLLFEFINIKDVPKQEEYEKDINNIMNGMHITRRVELKSYDENLITNEIPLVYANAYVQIGNFFNNYYKNPEKADFFYRKALWVDNEYHYAYALLGLNKYLKNKDCKTSTQNLLKAIDIYPIKKTYYLQLYDIYNKCHVSKKYFNDLKKNYKEKFDKKIEDDFRSFDIYY